MGWKTFVGCSKDPITTGWSRIISFRDGMLRAEFRAALKPINDLERLTNRIAGGTAQPRDLNAMIQTLQELPGLKGI